MAIAAFGAPQGQRVGDAAKAMAFHRLAAATPPMTLRRPNPEGASAERPISTINRGAPGPMHKGIESRRATWISFASRRRAAIVIPVPGHWGERGLHAPVRLGASSALATIRVA